MSAAQIRVRVARGNLFRVYRGVYAVGHIPTAPVAKAAAAVLACGPGAVLSHASAAALWGFGTWPKTIEVTAPSALRRPGIRVHRSTTLVRADRTRHLGIPVTTAARTIMDLSPRHSDEQLARIVNDALISRFMYESHLEALIERHPKQASRLRQFIRDPLSRSWFERVFRPWLKRYALPQPEFNVRIGRYEADVYYPRERLIVELDGYDFHRTRLAFENDRERDAHMLHNGIATIRITTRRIENASAREAARLHAILQSRTA